MKTHFGSFLPQSIFGALPGLFITLVKGRFVVRRFGSEYVVDDASHLVRCGGRRLRRSKLCTHAAEELPEIVFGSTKRMGFES